MARGGPRTQATRPRRIRRYIQATHTARRQVLIITSAFIKREARFRTLDRCASAIGGSIDPAANREVKTWNVEEAARTWIFRKDLRTPNKSPTTTQFSPWYLVRWSHCFRHTRHSLTTRRMGRTANEGQHLDQRHSTDEHAWQPFGTRSTRTAGNI